MTGTSAFACHDSLAALFADSESWTNRKREKTEALTIINKSFGVAGNRLETLDFGKIYKGGMYEWSAVFRFSEFIAAMGHNFA